MPKDKKGQKNPEGSKITLIVAFAKCSGFRLSRSNQVYYVRLCEKGVGESGRGGNMLVAARESYGSVAPRDYLLVTSGTP